MGNPSFGARDARSLLCILLFVAAAANVYAQEPYLTWGQYNWEQSYARCMECSPSALSAAGFQSVTKRSGLDRGYFGDRMAGTGQLSGMVICYGFGEYSKPIQSLVTVVVAHSSNDSARAIQVRKAVEKGIFECSDCPIRGVVVPCSPQQCGGYSSNVGMFQGAGEVQVCTTGNRTDVGKVVINMGPVTAGANIESGRTFELHLGTFGTNEEWSGGPVGSVTSDGSGMIQGDTGIEVSLPLSGKHFVFNSGGKSQFIAVMGN